MDAVCGGASASPARTLIVDGAYLGSIQAHTAGDPVASPGKATQSENS
ncbi:MAG: hypothetical protein U1E97_08730 [Alphaproteobacteria bacterium]